MYTNNLYITEEIDLTKEFERFIRQFCNMRKLSVIDLLSKKLYKLAARRPEQVDGNNLPRGKPSTGHSGVYAIFVRHRRNTPLKCFYVGMSNSDIRGRIRTHITIDVEKKYGQSHGNNFADLKKCNRVIVCWVIVNLNGLAESKKTKQRLLELLESCLSVSLRPQFMIPCR